MGCAIEILIMDDEILVRCSALKITKDGETIVTLDDIRTVDVIPSMELVVLGKVMTTRPYNFEAFKRTMNQIWRFNFQRRLISPN